jgi:hypothetical protein
MRMGMRPTASRPRPVAAQRAPPDALPLQLLSPTPSPSLTRCARRAQCAPRRASAAPRLHCSCLLEARCKRTESTRREPRTVTAHAARRSRRPPPLVPQQPQLQLQQLSRSRSRSRPRLRSTMWHRSAHIMIRQPPHQQLREREQRSQLHADARRSAGTRSLRLQLRLPPAPWPLLLSVPASARERASCICMRRRRRATTRGMRLQLTRHQLRLLRSPSRRSPQLQLLLQLLLLLRPMRRPLRCCRCRGPAARTGASPLTWRASFASTSRTPTSSSTGEARRSTWRRERS